MCGIQLQNQQEELRGLSAGRSVPRPAPTHLFVGMADHDRLNSIFDNIDTDRSGEISPKELIMHFLALGQEHESISELFRVMDTDGNGSISRAEFIAGHDKLAAFQKRQPNAAAVAAAA